MQNRTQVVAAWFTSAGGSSTDGNELVVTVRYLSGSFGISEKGSRNQDLWQLQVSHRGALQLPAALKDQRGILGPKTGKLQEVARRIEPRLAFNWDFDSSYDLVVLESTSSQQRALEFLGSLHASSLTKPHADDRRSPGHNLRNLPYRDTPMRSLIGFVLARLFSMQPKME